MKLIGGMMRRFGWILALGLIAAQATAQLRIEITSGVERAVPVAIVPFGWQGPGAAPYDLAGLVAEDLRQSGRFDPIPVGNMITRPTEARQINYNDWRMLRVDVVVIGRLVETGADAWRASFEIFDVLRGQQIFAFRYDTNASGFRETGHRIADDIYEQLTGVRGVFNTQIAYVTENRSGPADERYKLIVADQDGENARIAAQSPAPIMSPAWSPDGRQLAYVSFEGDQSAIYVQTLRTGNRQRVSARAGVNAAPAFSPDGRRLALTLSMSDGNLDIYTLELATQQLRRLTDNVSVDTSAEWSPDGESIYFLSDRAGRQQIYRTPSSPGGRASRVTFEGSANARPRIAPDGESMAVEYSEGQDRWQIAVVDPETGFLRQVLTRGSLDESPSFAPNGATIIYATKVGGTYVLASVSSDGRVSRQIQSADGDVREPVWSPYRLP